MIKKKVTPNEEVQIRLNEILAAIPELGAPTAMPADTTRAMISTTGLLDARVSHEGVVQFLKVNKDKARKKILLGGL